MKWLNLRKNKCPKCNKDLINGLSIKPLTKDAVWTHKCGFSISEKKFKEITTSMNEDEINKLEN